RKMRPAPCDDPRTWPTRNCSSSTVSTPRSPSDRAVAEPITPAPTTTTLVRSTNQMLPGGPRGLRARMTLGRADPELVERSLPAAPAHRADLLNPRRRGHGDGDVGAESTALARRHSAERHRPLERVDE